MATIVSVVGLYFSYDRPSGPTIMVCFAIALILGGIGRAIALSPRRSRALALTAGGIVLVVTAGLTLYRFRPLPAGHDERGHHGDEGGPEHSPEHEVGTGIAELRAALRDSHENVRARAVANLAETGDLRILPDLIDALHDQSPVVREAAAAALGRAGNPSAIPALKHLLTNEDEDEWVRLRVAHTVADLGDREGLTALLDLAKEGDAKLTRLEALATLLQLSGSADAPPDDPDVAEAKALIQKLERWAQGSRLTFDPVTRTYRPRR
jgi:hypothetical protein